MEDSIEVSELASAAIKYRSRARIAEARIAELEKAITETINENLHLADGEDCTLARLKAVIRLESEGE